MKPTSTKRKLKRRLEKGDKSVGLLGQPSGKFDYIVNYTVPGFTTPVYKPTGWEEFPPKEEKMMTLMKNQTPKGPTESCHKEGRNIGHKRALNPVRVTEVFMMSSSDEYDKDFPPIRPYKTIEGSSTFSYRPKIKKTLETAMSKEKTSP